MIRITQRQAILALLVLLNITTAAIDVVLGLRNGWQEPLLMGSILLVLIGISVAYWRGIEWSRWLMVGFVTIICAVFVDKTQPVSLMTLIPPLMALIMGSSTAVIISAVVGYGGILVRSNFDGVYAAVDNLVAYGLIVAAMVLIRTINETNLLALRETISKSDGEQRRIKAQSTLMRNQADALLKQNQEQQRLFTLVETLETPAVTIAANVLLAPLVGALDTKRIEHIQKRLLATIHRQRTRLLILDMAGVRELANDAAEHVLLMIQAIRLLGCEVTVTSASAEIAMQFGDLGVDRELFKTAQTPQIALEQSVYSVSKH
ncbi:STAS domain-containing protein [Herpetosiphon giganteus]|uniref:STAS domain-containing protein n=1 Tax=Herpetosiphon giganteus TaxID=2029754 RepID=UPI001956CE5C|nr:STAS domain-containing protein [Herpetosiphon giganteus]MBM7843878.1 anti-anti-sigma regulatory factor [Herpetosiphon giganteus]